MAQQVRSLPPKCNLGETGYLSRARRVLCAPVESDCIIINQCMPDHRSPAAVADDGQGRLCTT